jgi:hypothetical protein
MLTLNSRTCQIGTSVNTRTEMHGEDSVPTIDLPLAAIMLSAAEFNALMDDEGAHDRLFRTRADEFVEPVFTQLAPLKFKDKFEDSTVNLRVGLTRRLIALEHVKLAKIKFEPKVGGLTSLSLAVQCTPTLDARITQLMAFLNHAAEVQIDFGTHAPTQAKQPELALGHGHAAATAGEGKGPSDDDGDDDDDENGEKHSGTDDDELDDEPEKLKPAAKKIAKKKTVPPKKRAKRWDESRVNGAHR